MTVADGIERLGFTPPPVSTGGSRGQGPGRSPGRRSRSGRGAARAGAARPRRPRRASAPSRTCSSQNSSAVTSPSPNEQHPVLEYARTFERHRLVVVVAQLARPRHLARGARRRERRCRRPSPAHRRPRRARASAARSAGRLSAKTGRWVWPATIDEALGMGVGPCRHRPIVPAAQEVVAGRGRAGEGHAALQRAPDEAHDQPRERHDREVAAVGRPLVAVDRGTPCPAARPTG